MKLDPVGVIGLGLLGRGIAASLLGAGFEVIAVETREQGGAGSECLHRAGDH